MKKISELVNELSRLPGIGKKSASRISYYLLKNKEIALEISKKIENAINSIFFCSVCGNFTETDLCNICTDSSRDSSFLCVVEEPKDILSIEDTGSFKGLYHILMGNINPLEGVGPEKLRIRELINRINSGHINEVLIATNPTVEGEATFLYRSNLLSQFSIKISRIATGIPMGGSLEYSDKITLGKAILSKHYL